MNLRPLDKVESENLAALNASGCESALLFITETGLNKSILDATEPIRNLLRDNNIHDYSVQGQGPDNKVKKSITILTVEDSSELALSLYRPETKKGDPRFWISNFSKFVRPNDVCAVFSKKEQLFLVNLTIQKFDDSLETRNDLTGDLPDASARRKFNDGLETADGFTGDIFDSVACLKFNDEIETRNGPIFKFLKDTRNQANAASQELLTMLREIAAKGPLKAVCQGDTAIGRSIETALGISINSSRNPDFKGIEIKSSRFKATGKQNRSTLFACVPDWKLSSCKSSKEILDRFGYQRGNDFKLYCEVSTKTQNSQGLRLSFEETKNWLHEVSVGPPLESICIWGLDTLHSRLSEKHRETFWIRANSIKSGTQELFELVSVMHTSKPSTVQFNRLIQDGSVTVDHLIKRTPTGGAQEKGPLFKIEKNKLPELFLGSPTGYSLV